MPEETGFRTGQIIKSLANNAYRVMQLLGQGKNASAYLVVAISDDHRGTFHTLKILQDPTNEAKLRAFNRERDFMRGLRHPSILRLTDRGRYSSNGQETQFYVCDYYTRTLEEVISQGKCTLARKLCYALQLSSALAYLADQRPAVIHCDIKPANIFVDGLNCALADFGLMRSHDIHDVRELGPSLHTYRSPDIVGYLTGQEALTPKSDVFQLGLTLAELFTGQNPCKSAESGSEPVEIAPLRPISGQLGNRIFTLLEWMLKAAPYERPTASFTIDIWQGILFDAIQALQQFEDRVL